MSTKNDPVNEADLTLQQQDALDAFRETKGRNWKVALRANWERASYPGVSVDHAAALQQIRNTLGPEWLTKYRGQVTPDAQENQAVLLEKVVASWEAGREAWTLAEAKELAKVALAKLGLPEPTWELSNDITPWVYADVEVDGREKLIVGASSGGVVSVSGDPFTPVKRETNTTLARVIESLTQRINSLRATVAQYVVLVIENTGSAAFDGLGRDQEIARIIDVAAERIVKGRINDIDFSLHDMNGYRVGHVEVTTVMPADNAPNNTVRLVIRVNNTQSEKKTISKICLALNKSAEGVRDGAHVFVLCDLNSDLVCKFEHREVPSLLREDGIGMTEALCSMCVLITDDDGFFGIADGAYRSSVANPDCKAIFRELTPEESRTLCALIEDEFERRFPDDEPGLEP
jgi:hypothetical protein